MLRLLAVQTKAIYLVDLFGGKGPAFPAHSFQFTAVIFTVTVILRSRVPW